MTAIEQLKQWVDGSDNIVFFGGAGVSTESGLPDFRGENGLYRQKSEIPPEVALSHRYFMAHTEDFYRFYRGGKSGGNIQPNAAHKKLAELEAAGKIRAVITQNADGLHQAAGSKNVLELHGSIHRNYCLKCGKLYDTKYIREETAGVPKCSCGGIIRPGVVLFGEGLDKNLLNEAARYIRDADVLIVAGTSLVVYPAAGLLDFYKGDKLVLINKMPTVRDKTADLIIAEPVGEVFAQL